ncbi:hypothetical protein GCM10020254_12480 [Streptomyces goshikiensis]
MPGRYGQQREGAQPVDRPVAVGGGPPLDPVGGGRQEGHRAHRASPFAIAAKAARDRVPGAK